MSTASQQPTPTPPTTLTAELGPEAAELDSYAAESAPCVVVTGASTGIGYAAAQEFVTRGFAVVGTVRKQEDADRLRAELGPRLYPVLMDVSDDASVQAAAAEIAALVGARRLAGLVNNAGIVVAGPLLHMDLDELRYQFDVNVVGVVAVTQALLPLLKARPALGHAPGRVVNISSVSGHITYPFLSPYAASKHALESISDGMRRELMLYGIDVVVMVLGAVQTPIWAKASEQDLARYARTDYAAAVAQMRAAAQEMGKGGLPAPQVSAAVAHALTTPKPKARYLMVNNYWMGWVLPRWLPTRLFDWAIAKQMGLLPETAKR